MLTWLGNPFVHRGRVTRRELLRAGTLGLTGLTLPRALAAEAAASAPRRARSCIFVLLNGGPSQLDTFDLKPDAPSGVRGPYRPIPTTAPGIFIGDKLPLLARRMHECTIVRSMHHHLSAHNTGAAYMLSGHAPASDAAIAPTPEDHPTYGSVVAKLAEPGPLPAFVLTPTYLFDMGFPTPSAGGGWLGRAYDPFPSAGGGWLGRAYDPFPVVRNQMMAGLPHWEGKLPVPAGMDLATDMSANRLQGRDALARGLTTAGSATPLDPHRRQALDLLLSPEARRAFDLSCEPDRVRDRYGRAEMGQVFLLARRLIEAGVRFVTANAVSDPPRTRLSSFQIWDTHFDHFRLYDSHLLPELDQALSALLTDLSERGLLQETLVLVAGEFGRTPQINNSDGGGRDHWPRAYSVLLAGGGIKGGQVYGQTDAVAGSVKDFPVRPDDLAATLYECLGIPADTVLVDSRQRPHAITEGKPVRALIG
jgi:hypothetical protein